MFLNDISNAASEHVDSLTLIIKFLASLIYQVRYTRRLSYLKSIQRKTSKIVLNKPVN